MLVSNSTDCVNHSISDVTYKSLIPESVSVLAFAGLLDVPPDGVDDLQMDQTSACHRVRSILDIACGPNRPKPAKADLPGSGATQGFINNQVEKFWIRTLHEAFLRHYSGADNVVVLSKARRDKDWMRSEFLHDVAVIERQMVRSAYLGHLLPVARRVLWQVESELSGDGRQVAVDFSKLVAGSAEGKLMIVRRPVDWQQDGQKRVCRFVEEMAVGCSGWSNPAVGGAIPLEVKPLSNNIGYGSVSKDGMCTRKHRGTPFSRASWRRERDRHLARA